MATAAAEDAGIRGGCGITAGDADGNEGGGDMVDQENGQQQRDADMALFDSEV